MRWSVDEQASYNVVNTFYVDRVSSNVESFENRLSIAGDKRCVALRNVNREFAWEPRCHVTSLFAVRKQRSWLSCGFLVAFDFFGKADAAPNVHGARCVQCSE